MNVFVVRMFRENQDGTKEYSEETVSADSPSEAYCAAVKARRSQGGWTPVGVRAV